jgi:23S rRNA (pseudouridine1915-N3)-methyltransferase
MSQSFPKLKIIAVGKVKKGWIQEGIQTYLKRSPELDIVEIKDSNPDQEADKILAMVKATEQVIALTEEGQLFSSVELATFISQQASNALVFVIGGPEGISLALKHQAAKLLSLSPMTFPHEIARLLLVEQLYRAKTILQNSRYHK